MVEDSQVEPALRENLFRWSEILAPEEQNVYSSQTPDHSAPAGAACTSQPSNSHCAPLERPTFLQCGAINIVLLRSTRDESIGQIQLVLQSRALKASNSSLKSWFNV